MSRLIDGFDYVAQRPTEMTRAEWQEKYPATIYRRQVEDGETAYYRIGGGRVAEAYANIPEARS